MPDFSELPLWINLAIFAATGVVVWAAGTRLSRYAGELSSATGLGDVTVGIVLLGVGTSLPEVAVSVTAAMRGAESLAVNNLLGGLAFQVTLLAVADAFIGRDALTSVNARPSVILQGTLDCILLTVVAIAITVGDVMMPGIGMGVWAFALVPLYALSVLLLGHARGRKAWRPARMGKRERSGEDDASDAVRPVRSLLLPIGIAALFVLVAGYFATRTAEAIAEQTGLGLSFVGAVLVAAATSLPELSAAIEAVRMGRVGLAFGDVFGTNLIDASLISVVDIASSGPPVLNEVGRFSMVAALLGVVLTMIYIVGLVERRDRVALRMGWDSIAVLVCYFAGLVLLFQLR